ncbi:hypothetical protein CAEBREN_02830 [Caenorhabditis brenneri]|uniref:DUF38 domain-containing protein n=1 Tax=Caenorhabditis brenneri TaxID=135651 RepID=G0NIA8_CAEBE|nr:hypothetical protein CAEBREN_02830 [Caenorhabditis brenneri]
MSEKEEKLPSLLDMPDVVMDEILEYLEFREIQNEIHKILYQGSEDQKRTEVVYEETRTTLQNRNFLEISLQDLQIILKSQKSLFRLFKILGSDHHEYVTRLTQILRPRPLQIEEFHMYIDPHQEEKILEILPLLDEKSIISISIYNNSEDRAVLKINELAKLEHWKRSEQLYISKFVVDIRTCGVGVFGHFSLVEMTVERVSGEEVLELKELFLRSPQFAIGGIKFIHFEDTSKFLKSCTITTANEINGRQEKLWFYGKSEIDDEILRISYSEQRKEMEFKRIRRACVPDDVDVEY